MSNGKDQKNAPSGGAKPTAAAAAPPSASAPATAPAAVRTRAGISTERKLAFACVALIAFLDSKGAGDNPLVKAVRDLADEIGGKQLTVINARIAEIAPALKALDFSDTAQATKGAELMSELKRLQKRKGEIQALAAPKTDAAPADAPKA